MSPVIKELKKVLEVGAPLYRRLLAKATETFTNKPLVREAYLEAHDEAVKAFDALNILDTISTHTDIIENATVAVAQHAFNKIIVADALDKADGRRFFKVVIDSIHFDPNHPDCLFSPTFTDSKHLEHVLGKVFQFATKYDFDRITFIAFDKDRDDVEVIDWAISRAAMQMTYFNEAEEMMYRNQVLDIVAAEGKDDLRADLIAFAVNPKEV